MPKNLVICCDGTNNSLAGVNTNVAYLNELSNVGNELIQVPYYDAGVGVEANPKMRTRVAGALNRGFGSAFGTGLVDNVEQAYLQLIRHYEAGDRIFMFGFSRGAYTVRVLAGLMQNYGLLKREHEKSSRNVVKAFQDLFPGDGSGYQAGKPTQAQLQRFDQARKVREENSTPAQIHFMGIFDTVSSLGWAWDPKSFPNTRSMPNVKVLRHALALDERRAKFRTNRVDLIEGCDHRQIWFAGVHSDVGGGYKPPNDRLSRVPLRWMLSAARSVGMHVNQTVEARLALDQSQLQDEQAPQNESLSAMWRTLEYLPLPHHDKTANGWVESRRVYGCKGWRRIPETFEAHVSLQRRKVAVKNVFWKSVRDQVTFVA